MHSSKTYYQSIFNRYNNVKNSLKIQTRTHISQKLLWMEKSMLILWLMIDFKANKDILKNKREAKYLFKVQNEVLEYYTNKMKHINPKTQKSYSRIISQFLVYSPSFDPDDLKSFIWLKFGYPKINDTGKENFKGAALNYYYCI